MQFLAVAALALFACLSTSVEAKHRQKWTKLVNSKCADKGNATVVVGGVLDKNLIRTVKRAQKKGVQNLSVAVNGRDLVKPQGGKKNRKRNVKFVQDVAGTYSFVVLPYHTGVDFSSVKAKAVVKSYTKSAEHLAKVLGTFPLVAHVNEDNLYKGAVKALSKAGFVVLGNTTNFEDSEDALDSKSFIVVQNPDVKLLSKTLKDIDGGLFTLVSLTQCLGQGIYDSERVDEESSASSSSSSSSGSSSSDSDSDSSSGSSYSSSS